MPKESAFNKFSRPSTAGKRLSTRKAVPAPRPKSRAPFSSQRLGLGHVSGWENLSHGQPPGGYLDPSYAQQGYPSQDPGYPAEYANPTYDSEAQASEDTLTQGLEQSYAAPPGADAGTDFDLPEEILDEIAGDVVRDLGFDGPEAEDVLARFGFEDAGYAPPALARVRAPSLPMRYGVDTAPSRRLPTSTLAPAGGSPPPSDPCPVFILPPDTSFSESMKQGAGVAVGFLGVGLVLSLLGVFRSR